MDTYSGIRRVCLVPDITRSLSHPSRSQGLESEAVVEFAPYQKIPADKKKADPRSGTILDGEPAPCDETNRLLMGLW